MRADIRSVKNSPFSTSCGGEVRKPVEKLGTREESLGDATLHGDHGTCEASLSQASDGVNGSRNCNEIVQSLLLQR
jgi:hypothetical protein